MTKKINEANDPMNPTIEIPGYGVVDLATLEMMLKRHFKEYTDIDVSDLRQCTIHQASLYNGRSQKEA